ncbi:MAG TPA: winged helix DNA-binding domain-containing protein, partial [Candidatus Limnocylindria bacterium]|nr:winged helix DNA-binding domain-containing protein [Candidatus Limnocylindria bacterium]
MATDRPVLDRRALNRALLARQHLLRRASMPAERMTEHLVGMQAQNPLDPYVALWSRLERFDPQELSGLVERRRAVRLGLMRGTLHLVTDRDALALWPVMAPVMARSWASSQFRRGLDGVDVDVVVGAGRALLEGAPRTTSELGRLLREHSLDRDAASLGYAVRFLLPIVQVPPRGLWGRSGQPTWTTLERWVGRPPDGDAAPDAALLRYLAAFGPANVADIRTWSWLTGLREVVERLRPRLVTFRDEVGRELFDLPDAPRPDPAMPAPTRFLPEYDNVLLSHADRSRILPDSALGRLTGWVGSFLVDGFVAGQWRIA